MQFYSDENFPADVISHLRLLGKDCLTAFEDGRANQRVSDAEVLQRATELNRTVLTINRLDFKRLHSVNPEHYGIVICTFDPDFIGQAERIRAAVDELGDIRRQLVRVNRAD